MLRDGRWISTANLVSVCVGDRISLGSSPPSAEEAGSASAGVSLLVASSPDFHEGEAGSAQRRRQSAHGVVYKHSFLRPRRRMLKVPK
jgi:hypothetical protein